MTWNEVKARLTYIQSRWLDWRERRRERKTGYMSADLVKRLQKVRNTPS